MSSKKHSKQTKKIAAIGNGKRVIINPSVKLSPCPNCHGSKCAMCNFLGVYRE